VDIQEGTLTFTFETDDGSLASQYDTWAFLPQAVYWYR